MHYAVAHLMKALRYSNPGINVRLPSHIEPPFRSINFNFQRRATTTGIQTPFAITFNGNTRVPDGVQGVISEVSFIGYPDDVDVVTGFRDFLLTIRKNGSPLPGFLQIRPGYTAGETLTDIAGTIDGHGDVPSPGAPARIHLKPGDVIDAIVFNPGPNVDADFELRLGGWLYPIEVEADGIVGTMADRGGPMPTRSPL